MVSEGNPGPDALLRSIHEDCVEFHDAITLEPGDWRFDTLLPILPDRFRAGPAIAFLRFTEPRIAVIDRNGDVSTMSWSELGID